MRKGMQHIANSIRVKVALSVLPVFLIGARINLYLDGVGLFLNLFWAIIALSTVGCCALIGHSTRGAHQISLWATCLLLSFLLLGFPR